MNEYPLTVPNFPSNTCYPPTVQGVIDLIGSFVTLAIEGNPPDYSISSTALPSTQQSQLWAQTYPPTVAGSYGIPKVFRLFTSGQWLEFAQLSRGDRILVPFASVILSPWGEYGYTYSFGDTSVTAYTPTVAPTPPAGYKYKTYVGYWSSKTP
jgi:hypothetical protein